MKKLTAFGITIQPGDANCLAEQNAQDTSGTGTPLSKYGILISAFAALTGGVTGSICDSDYGQTLTSIGARLRDGITTLTLTDIPVLNSVRVVLVPHDPALTWTVEGKTLRFNFAPAKGTRVDVSYTKQ